MKRIPRPVLRALEALAQSPINTSALAMAEGQDFAHDTLYRALNQPLASFFGLSLELCKAMGGLDRGYLILDDVLIQRYRSGKLGLKKARDTSTGAWVFGLSLVVLGWTDGKRRIPLAFLPYFGEESKLDLSLVTKDQPWAWSHSRTCLAAYQASKSTPSGRKPASLAHSSRARARSSLLSSPK
jgi:putative transposase